MIDASIIAYAVSKPDGLVELQRSGVELDDFVDEYRTAWRYICKAKQQHDTVPSPDTLQTRFPDMELPNVKKRELPLLLSNIKKRRKFIEFLTALNDAAGSATDYEQVDELVQELQGRLNSLHGRDGESGHLIDLFDSSTGRRMAEELHKRRSGQVVGIPTGLNKLDSVTGGLQRQKMITIIGRTSTGKSWLNLLFVANAVINGEKVMLYPLEMTLEETAFRLYTIFSQRMFGGDKVIRNYDLTMGKVTKKKLVRFLGSLEDRFQGQLYVADVGALSNPYTIERIEAEVDIYRPSMFWVDYLTLLKTPGGGGEKDWQAVQALSEGIKNTAMRRDTVGGCSAQVNREAMREKVFLPGPEHISFGDSIGQDSDLIVSVNKRKRHMYYRLAKHRGGMEFGKTKMQFEVNEGIISELEEGEQDGEES